MRKRLDGRRPATDRGRVNTRPGPRRPKQKRRSGISASPWRRPPLTLPALIRLSIYTIFMAGLLFAVAVAYTAETWPLPRPGTPGNRESGYAILASDGSLIGERGQNGAYVPLDRLPVNLIDAVLATEDRHFYQHFGVDFAGLARATLTNLRARGVVQGGSTITQQLAKNLFLDPERTLSRKLQEVLIAFSLEARLDKRTILELYLNRAYFGFGAYGIEAAARRYFGKAPEELTLPEAALLAGLLKAPTRYAPTRDLEAARARRDVVLQNMAEARIISARAARAAMAEPVRLAPDAARREPGSAEYAVDWIMEQIPRLIGRREGRFIVETTLDAPLQRMAQRTAEVMLASEGHEARASQAAVVALGADGSVRAMVGGRSYSDSPFNRATRAHRQPGSAFKPFVYLAAIENGYDPGTEVVDEPVAIGNWQPANYGPGFQGRMPLRQAFARSINTVAVQLYVEIGRSRIAEVARRLGITSPLGLDASLALGTSEVTPLELAGAYVPFANGGTGVSIHAIRRIAEADGHVIYSRLPTASQPVIDTTSLLAMRDLLGATIREGTGRQAMPASPGLPVGGKTGTTQDYRDAWFVGYAGELTAAVWVGNDDGSSMRKVTGGGLPARIWRGVMEAAFGRGGPSGSGRISVAAADESDSIALLIEKGSREGPAIDDRGSNGGSHPSTP